MTDAETEARAELEDVLRRLLPDLLDRDDDPLLAEWTLVLATVSGVEGGDVGGDVDVLTGGSSLTGHVLGALRIATISLEAEILAE